MNNLRIYSIASLLAFGLSAMDSLESRADKPQTPVIEALEASPAVLELTGIRDSRRLLVTGKTADGKRVDLTTAVKLAPTGDAITIDEDGYIVPLKSGKAAVTVTAAGKTLDVPVTISDVSPRPISFIRDVVPVMSKAGCNQGTCHGSQKGQAGFKLSLRGYDTDYDYRALVDELSGRRFNRSTPRQSLMLLKPTQGVPHEGGFLFDEQSRYYKIIEQWIAEGCNYVEETRVSKIEIFPKQPILGNTSDVQQMIVIATYDDGTTRDVTREAVFSSSIFETATVSDGGLVTAVRRGETAILVRYEGNYAANPVTVLGARSDFVWQDSPQFNFIDGLVNNKLQRMKVQPSDLADDAQFFRRVSLDLIGMPPSSDQVRAFLEDKRDSATKRAAKIEEFLASPDYVTHWSLKWSDLLLNNRKYMTEKGVWGFRNWLRSAVASNMSYQRFVRELITAGGSTFENPAANYYRISTDPTVAMENMTQVFIGTRFTCNRCHDHPFERWTQGDFYHLAAYFSAIGHKKGAIKGEEIIYTLAKPNPVKHPKHGGTVEATFPYTYEGAKEPTGDLRNQLADWLTAAENPYFAKSIVNRYWSYFFGRGIIDPVDDIRSSNPASNPELLAALTEDFIAHDFDLKYLIRTIVSSHTYQRSFKTNQWNKTDAVNNSHAMPRRLTAEQLYDAIITATGRPVNLPGVPAGFRAAQLPDARVEVSFLDMFGRPPRESPCECERSSDVSLAQTLNLINGPTIGDSIIHKEGLIARLTAEKANDDKMIEEIYLSVICRMPTAEESKQTRDYFASVGNQAEAAEDLMWALINSPAFLFNR